jgi:KUP system potassium uptake protein
LSTIADAKAAVLQPPQGFKPIAVLTALGIVYGDIGTSPLYVYQAIAKINGGHFGADSALGSLSLIVWTLLIVVALKYAVVVMRADNRGEGAAASAI